MPDDPQPSAEEIDATIDSRAFSVLLVVAAIVGLLVSIAAWCFLELTVQLQRGVFVHLPSDLGYDNGPPIWWALPVLAIAGLIVAFAIDRLPGRGGHIPARGLQAGGSPMLPLDLPGVLLAATATVGLGIVLGPEAPLIALGAGLGALTIKLARKDAPAPLITVVSAAGSFAAMSFLFESPVIAAVIMIEAIGLGGPKLTMVLLPGLMASGIGSLVSLGMGSLTGLSSSAYALGSIENLPKFLRPDFVDFAWSIPLAALVAIVCHLMVTGGLRTAGLLTKRSFPLVPVIGLIIAGLAILFHATTGKPFEEVFFSGQDLIPSLLTNIGDWSLGTIALLILFKGLAYSLSLGSFRGGPTFPALFLGALAGVMAGHLPGFDLTPALAVGMTAATAAVLRLPLSAIVITSLLTAGAGGGDEPLVILASVIAYLISRRLRPSSPPAAEAPRAAPAPAAASA